MASVQVLCPNGRRQNVKITPNTKILQVLEEVCKKQGFMPPEDYDLIHGVGRKRVDVTLSVRYANLPNNAKLELVKSQSTRAEQDILIALQLESGERLQEKFSPKTSLWNILQHWENKSDSVYKDMLTKVDATSVPPTQPVCIYMREEVIGEMALTDTNLRKLGLTGGKAVIRLVHRPVDDTIMAEIIEKLEREQAKMARLDQIAKQKSQTDKDDAINVSTSKIENASQNKPGTDSCTGVPMTDQSRSKCTVGDSSAELMETQSSLSSSTQQEQPMETESESQRGSNQTAINLQGNPVAGGSGQGARGGVEALRQMNIPGVQIFTPQDFHELSPEEQEVARKLAARFMPGMGISPAPQTSANRPAQESRPKRQKRTQPFADFKFPEETKGKDLYQNEFSDVKMEDFKPCERETVIFSLTEEVTSPTADVPDDFFNVTENDIKKMMVDLQKKVEAMGDQPLMTASMREAMKDERYDKYEKVIIRVQFPDKLILQGLFRPRETVFAVEKFVKGYLENKNLSFYLYTSPPKCVLKDSSKTLIQASLVPATLVYFGSSENHEHYLSQAVLGEVGSRLTADRIVAACLHTEMSDTSSSSSSVTAGASGVTRPRPKQTNAPKDSKEERESGVPKWFKIGKK